MKQKRQRKFRNLLINPRYQIKYTLFLSVTGLVLVGGLGAIAYYYLSENYAMFIDLTPMTDEARGQLEGELRAISRNLAVAGVLFLGVVAALGVIFSHRVAGPMYHFKRIFDEVKKGNRAARVRLRPTDEFQDVAKSFNEMMDSQPK